MLKKRAKNGRMIDDISKGEKLTLSEKIMDKDILLYLGLTDDANPLFIQHDYASQTPYKRPIVPTSMLTGIITSAISKYLPGPGSNILKQSLEFPRPVYHYETIQLLFEIISVDKTNHTLELYVQVTNEKDEIVIIGSLIVCPPYRLEKMEGKVLENF
ncbi:MaoC/PaaZ C-terminal domain-containing protein [Bacillus massilinigeriensis]|uniref:MaoC/PaaZ C-terminal domain-containing protein n=1 Tax=Bacillus massilionigeriensis TaxID=1805475 RepID=UPI00096B43BA|nr:MaoC/PaaZ C-terminal domain-containing protein [Bacillus massilionigeriensis]